MSDATTPPSQQFDSALDRARLRLLLEEMRKDVDAHFVEDKSMHTETSRKLDELLAMRTQLRAVIALILCFGAGGVALARWGIGHAVRDTLVDAKVIHYTRAP